LLTTKELIELRSIISIVARLVPSPEGKS